MNHSEGPNGCPLCKSRRQFLRTGVFLAAAAGAGTLWKPEIGLAEDSSAELITAGLNGSTDPFPIPWVDKNGSHNQMPKPGMDPSDIFHFKGRVARCNNFTGMGTDNKGNRIAFGSPTTDFSFIHGEYFAARTNRQGTFAHI